MGISGDWRAAGALQAGFDVWYSVLAGLFPQTALAIARSKDLAQSERLEPLWALFRQHGSLRVIAAAAELLGHVSSPALPFPLQTISGAPREALAKALAQLDLA
jgi:4-hydroxy-tetrahydrodipicolinate synthase